MKKIKNKKTYSTPFINKIGKIPTLTLGNMNQPDCDGMGCVGSGGNPNRCDPGRPVCS